MRYLFDKNEKNMRIKLINALRIIGFAGTILTSLPLFVHYLAKTTPDHRLIVHLHVWFGLLFILFAVTSMILNRRENNNRI